MLHTAVLNSKKALPETIVNAKDGDIFEKNFNFTQPTLRPIFVGLKNLTFIDGNLANCILPEGSKVIGCQTGQYSFGEITHPVPERRNSQGLKPVKGIKSTFIKKLEHSEPTELELITMLEPHKEQRQKEFNKRTKWLINS